MIPRRERLSVNLEVLASQLLDGCAETAILVITFAFAAILVYRSSPTAGIGPREFTGKIVDKRISVYESQQGSSFRNTLVVEEPNGKRFLFTVTDEMYARAKVGMWIRRTRNGIELLAQRELNAEGP